MSNKECYKFKQDSFTNALNKDNNSETIFVKVYDNKQLYWYVSKLPRKLIGDKRVGIIEL